MGNGPWSATPSAGNTVKPTTPAVEKPEEQPSATSSHTTQPVPVSTPSATPSEAASSAITNNSGDVSSGDISKYLADHNTFRAQHGADPLTWSDSLSSYAQNWANKCVFEHSNPNSNGENLAAGTGSYTIDDAINAWTSESSQYDPEKPVFSHFTQVVWKGTTQVGCAVTKCGGGKIFDASFGPAEYYVCEYYPPGNVEGEFAQNVQA